MDSCFALTGQSSLRAQRDRVGSAASCKLHHPSNRQQIINVYYVQDFLIEVEPNAKQDRVPVSGISESNFGGGKRINKEANVAIRKF